MYDVSFLSFSLVRFSIVITIFRLGKHLFKALVDFRRVYWQIEMDPISLLRFFSLFNAVVMDMHGAAHFGDSTERVIE